MARKKHWWHCSHDFADDPVILEMTEKYGDRTLRLALKIYSILDLCENRWEVNEAVFRSLFRVCGIYPKTGFRCIEMLLEKHLLLPLKTDSTPKKMILGSPNYWKYHPRECRESDFAWLPPEQNRTELTLYRNKESKPDPPSAEASALPSPDLKLISRRERNMGRSMNLIPELKAETDRLYFSDRVKFKDLAKWVAESRKYEFSEPDMAEALRQFWDIRLVIDHWYPYLDKILEEVENKRKGKEQKQEIRKFEAEHERRKREEGKFAKEWLGDGKTKT
jgi:hypothetical protein